MPETEDGAHSHAESQEPGGRCFHSDIGMNGSDTVPPLCAAFGCRDGEWGPVDPRAGRQA